MNIEIIPNWHPIFVHFTIGLLGISALLYLATLIFKKESLLVAARWNLWIGAIITAGTVLAGFQAYNTVAHDAASHAAMTDHRNWGLVTAGLFTLLALWATWKQRTAKTVHPLFVLIIIGAAALLAITGYKGGEVVYRHGTGVLRLPEVHDNGGHDSHIHKKDHHKVIEEKPADHHDHSAHPH